MKKKVFIVVLITALLLFSIFLKSIIYGLDQAAGQFKVLWNAQPIEDVIQDQAIADSLKQKIRLIQEVRKFAVDSLGLTNSKNYTTFYDQEGETILWNLSASEPYQLQPKTWSFPFLGSFPYKGFFDLDKAKKEYDQLLLGGYDARIRTVGGWSTLGWFKDPILSNMLERSEGNLAELIIHELTHSTLFIKDNIEFNENLASFIGERGAILFLKYQFGNNSNELTEYVESEEDAKTFTNHMLFVTSKIDSLYSTYSEETPDSVKHFSKHLLIDQITSSLDTISFNDHRYNEVFYNGRPNNAYFLSYLRYHSSEDSLRNLLETNFKNDLSTFIQEMKNHHE